MDFGVAYTERRKEKGIEQGLEDAMVDAYEKKDEPVDKVS